jgi:hypothetical protein
MLERNELLQLMKATAMANRSNPVAYSFNGESLGYDAMNETLRRELNELAGSYSLYRENKNTIFSLIEQTIDLILPKKVAENYAQFAETKTFKQGDKPIFNRRGNTHQRAKQFITKVGLAGIYEVFKLGKERPFELQTSAVGGAAAIGFEEFLDGRVDFAEVTAIVMEGIDELIYREIARAFMTSIDQLPEANRVEAAGFDEQLFDRLIMVASQYGTPTIYCTYEFAVKILPQRDWISDNMKDEIWRNGHFASYKNTKIVILPQGFEDESNTKKVIDPGFCWIIPGGHEKPVKVAFEGDTIVDEWNGKDRSREIQVYKKVGVGVLMGPDICVYVDTELLGQLDVIVPAQDGE